MIALALAAALMSSPAAGARPLHVTPAALRTAPPAPAPMLQNVAVTLECTATPQGRAVDCFVLAETHPGLGFDQAAIALMRDAELDPVPRPIQFARTIQFTP